MIDAFDQLARLSHEPEDAQTIASQFSVDGPFTETRELNLTSPTAANIAAFLATLLNDMKNAR